MNIDKIILNVIDFTDYPGPRFISQGNYSGELFFKEKLLPGFNKALESNCKLVVNLDGTFGYASSFLDEAFGRLVREFGKEKVENTLEIISEEDNSWIDLILNQTLNQWPKK